MYALHHGTKLKPTIVPQYRELFSFWTKLLAGNGQKMSNQQWVLGPKVASQHDELGAIEMRNTSIRTAVSSPKQIGKTSK